MDLNNTIIKICLLTLLFSSSAHAQTAAEDEVHWPIPGYTEHKWYSGKTFIIQVI